MAFVTNKLNVINQSKLHQKLFFPSLQTNIDSTPIMTDLAFVAANAIQAESHDIKKGKFKYLSDLTTGYSWTYFHDEMKTAMLGKQEMKDL